MANSPSTLSRGSPSAPSPASSTTLSTSSSPAAATRVRTVSRPVAIPTEGWLCVGTELFTMNNGHVVELEVHGRPIDSRGTGTVSHWAFKYAAPGGIVALVDHLPQCIHDFSDDQGRDHRSFRWSGPPTAMRDHFRLARTSNGGISNAQTRALAALEMWMRLTGSSSVPRE